MAKQESKNMSKYSDTEIIDSFFACWANGDHDDIKSALYALIKRFGGTPTFRGPLESLARPFMICARTIATPP